MITRIDLRMNEHNDIPYSAQPLDPGLEALADQRRTSRQGRSFKDLYRESREKMYRATIERNVSALAYVASIEDGVAGTVPIRIYRPGPLPAPTLLFFHGGGFALGGIAEMDHIARKICSDLQSVVVSVGYRLAPENVYPAAHDDALAVTEWAAEKIGMLGGRADMLGLVGESAGATLAASTSQTIRDKHLRIKLCAQLLIVPGLDFARDLNSLRKEGHGFPMISPDDLEDIGHLYLADRHAEANCCPPSPARASDLSGLPPTTIVVAGHDPLRDEGLHYAAALETAGVRVEVLQFPALLHHFFGLFEINSAASAAVAQIHRCFGATLTELAVR